MITAKEHALIKNCFLFSGISAAALKKLLSDPRCLLVHYEKNASIDRAGTNPQSLGLVLEGKVEAIQSDNSSSLRSFSPGEIFGAANLFGTAKTPPSRFQAKAQTRILFLGYTLMKDFMEQDFTLTENYIRFLQGRIHYLNARIATLGAPNAEAVLLKYLEKEAGDAKQVFLDCSMAELAQRLGISRASLYRAVDSLSKKSLLKKYANTFHLLC